MAKLIPSDLPTIAQAVEQKLLSFGNAGDITNIYWVEEGQLPPPVQTGQRDILLYELPDDFEGSESSTVVGSGRGAAIRSGLNVAIRTSRALDNSGTRKQWFINHRPMINSLLDALMDFFPEDGQHNALTVEGFVATKNTTPERMRDTTTWGYSVASFKFHYLPSITGVAT